MIRNECIDAINDLDHWAAPVAPSVGIVNKMDTCLIVPQPLGTVLIIGAWNYAIQLTLVPLIGALAAGNCAVVKPSELSPAVAELLGKLIPKYFPTGTVRVLNGGVEETTEMLKLKYDKIFYTGNGRVAKIILRAAAEHLTPVVLELGGKSPVFVDQDADAGFVETAGRRIAWGRFMNAGQTCIAPDYVMTHPSMIKPLTQSIQKALLEYFGADPQKSDSYARLPNALRFKALTAMLKGQEQRVVIGGQTDEKDLYIAPTVLEHVSFGDACMADEIFGPILPLIAVDSIDAAIAHVNAGDKPLALYVFSRDKAVTRKFIESTSSGGALSNDCIMHVAVPELPFGGVGGSGMGAYHGKLSFDTFSHSRAVMLKDIGGEFLMNMRYPPYTAQKMGMVLWLAAKSPNGVLKKVLGNSLVRFALLAACAYAAYARFLAK